MLDQGNEMNPDSQLVHEVVVQVLGQLARLAQQKYSSNVVEVTFANIVVFGLLNMRVCNRQRGCSSLGVPKKMLMHVPRRA